MKKTKVKKSEEEILADLKARKIPFRVPRTRVKANRYTDEEKKLVVNKVLMAKLETPRRSIESIARSLCLNGQTVLDWLRDSNKYQKYLEEQKAIFNMKALKVMNDGVDRMGEKIKTANLPHATVAVGVLHDKVFGTQPIAEIKVGDNRQVSVYYPNFKPSSDQKEEEPQVAEEIQQTE